MSDLIVSRGSSSTGFTITGGSSSFGGVSGGSSSTPFAATASSADVSSNIVAQIDDDINNIGNLSNPYTKLVVVSSRWISGPNGTGFWAPIYATNTSWADFEAQATNIQNEMYNSIYTETSLSISAQIQSATSEVNSTYSSDRYGDTSSIESINAEILSIQKEIDLLSLQDNITQDYNRVADTDNSERIAELEAELASASSEYTNIINAYNNKKSISDLLEAREAQERANSGDWNVDYNWMQEDLGIQPSYGGLYTPMPIQDVSNYYQTEQMNDWMAGGTLYDAPRAGDVLFNPLGDLNTVRFLGLNDTNMNAHLQRELYGMADVQKMLGISAGDKNFSIF